MLQMLFQDKEGKPLCAYPRDREGHERAADGVEFLSLAQAAARFSMAEDDLRDMWVSTWRDLMPADDLSLLADAPATAGQDAPDAAAPDRARSEQRRRDLLHVIRYPNLSNEQFDYFMEVCRRRALNPWADQIYADTRHSEKTGKPEVVVIVGIQGLRLIADRTERYCGNDAAVFSYGDDPRLPTKAEATVYKLVGGVRHPFTADVLWDEYFPPDDAFWLEKPHVCLAKCAEAAALRKAFPHDLGCIYTPEEMARARRRRPDDDRGPLGGGGAVEPVEADEPLGSIEPMTRQQFELRLVDLGLGNPRRRAEAIGALSRKFANLSGGSFYAAALREVERNPSEYGVAEPAAVA